MSEQPAKSSNRPDEFLSALVNCKFGAKSLQNVKASLASIDLLYPLRESQQWDLMSALYCSAVVRYTKPFSGSRSNRTYPIKRIKHNEGFSSEIHKHLLEIRDVLVAHDDLDIIEPKFMVHSYKFDGIEYPMSATITNKCLGYPGDWGMLAKIRSHVQSCFDAMRCRLTEDMHAVIDAHMRDPERNDECLAYAIDILSGVMPGTPIPKFVDDAFLDVVTPKFENVHGGYIYDQYRWPVSLGPIANALVLLDGRKIPLI